MHIRKDIGKRMTVLLKAHKLAMNSKIYLILMICARSRTLQCDKQIVCHVGIHFFNKLKSFLACIPLFL